MMLWPGSGDWEQLRLRAMDGWKNVSLSTLEGVDADIIGCHTVYRVNWLRAKARFDRWDEEDEIVRSEMRWTLLYFEHHTKA